MAAKPTSPIQQAGQRLKSQVPTPTPGQTQRRTGTVKPIASYINERPQPAVRPSPTGSSFTDLWKGVYDRVALGPGPGRPLSASDLMANTRKNGSQIQLVAVQVKGSKIPAIKPIVMGGK